MNRVAILGPGLLGGSLALALRERTGAEIAVWGRRAEAVAEVAESGFADLASVDVREVVEGADMVVLCTPIGVMPALAGEIAPALASTALVTDVGSVKSPVVKELQRIFTGNARFIGSHPMAGSERAGWSAARANLFDGSVCIVTPDEHCAASDVSRLSEFWKLVGCEVRYLSPDEHDEIVALVSHLPHLIAAGLVEMIETRNPAAFDFCGPGFRDTTRVASGPSAMWAEILQSNRTAVRKSAEAMIEKLREIVTLLDCDSAAAETPMNDFLTRAKARRDRLRLPS